LCSCKLFETNDQLFDRISDFWNLKDRSSMSSWYLHLFSKSKIISSERVDFRTLIFFFEAFLIVELLFNELSKMLQSLYNHFQLNCHQLQLKSPIEKYLSLLNVPISMLLFILLWLFWLLSYRHWYFRDAVNRCCWLLVSLITDQRQITMTNHFFMTLTQSFLGQTTCKLKLKLYTLCSCKYFKFMNCWSHNVT
jgi:hypothetical protein